MADIKSLWVGLRPLVKPSEDDAGNTKALSREHTIAVSPSGLLTVTGGKWTTYRAMAEDVMEQCAKSELLPRRPPATDQLKLVGAQVSAHSLIDAPGLHLYGSEAADVTALRQLHDQSLDEGLTPAMVRFAVRHEYARTVEDVLARRSRMLFLDAALASRLADKVGLLIARETGADPEAEAFKALCTQYLACPL